MRSAQKVVVLGASLVGVKVAEILRKRDVEVILLDVASQLLPRGAHPQAAEKLRSYFERKGIEIRIGCSLEGMEQQDEGVCCFFPDQIVEQADFVAVCTGIQPNLQFLEPGHLKIDEAIVVDDHMQTSAENLYAAGDVCQGLNRQTGQLQWLGTWGNACYQGRVAGYNMAGKAASHPGAIPQHVSPFFDWTYAQIGDANRSGEDIETIISGNPESKNGYQILVYEKEILVGANVINRLQDIGTLKRAITQATPWQPNQPILDIYP
jgi:assimilatory nitrate reductase electron transfer subunit/3-phenylpropionate/trans-cinnamate dioxygenase ferredoxin reductase subunit